MKQQNEDEQKQLIRYKQQLCDTENREEYYKKQIEHLNKEQRKAMNKRNWKLDDEKIKKDIQSKRLEKLGNIINKLK